MDNSKAVTVLLCILTSVLVQIFLPHLLGVIRILSCSYFQNFGYPVTTDLAAGITTLPDLLTTHRTEYESGVVLKRHDADPVSPTLEKEALSAVSAAQSYRQNGNFKKAKIVIEHAISLLPHHPDVLTERGLIFEHLDNFIEADLCYVKALVFNPAHRGALERRRRTQPIVHAADQKLLNEIDQKKEVFNRLAHTTTLRRAMRESYFSHIYHTVAIEGNTLLDCETRSILETGFVVPGKSIVEHNEVIGMDSALRYLNSSLLNLNEITLDDILEIHLRVLGNVNPIDAGRIRSTQVYVGRFTPVAPEFVREQMEELIEWLNSPLTAEIDPVERAAIAHYKLVLIHPFVDGNGRTARLLLNLILMKSGFPPVILPVETRSEYYVVLNTANLGDLRPFVRYVAKHTADTLQHYISLSTASCSTGLCNSVISPEEPQTIVSSP